MNKPIFKSYNSDIKKNAYMNWRTSFSDQMQNMCVFAEGYALAAKILAEAKETDHSYIIDSDYVTIDVEYLLTRTEEIRNALESLTLNFGAIIDSREEVMC